MSESETQLTLHEEIANIVNTSTSHGEAIRDVADFVEDYITQALTSLRDEMDGLKREVHTEHRQDCGSCESAKNFNQAISECQRVIGGYLK